MALRFLYLDVRLLDIIDFCVWFQQSGCLPLTVELLPRVFCKIALLFSLLFQCAFRAMALCLSLFKCVSVSIQSSCIFPCANKVSTFYDLSSLDVHIIIFYEKIFHHEARVTLRIKSNESQKF